MKKKEEKLKLTFRKDVLSDMKRNRHDAALQVIQCFDDEQEAYDLLQFIDNDASGSLPPSLLEEEQQKKKSGLDELFLEIPTLRQSLHLSSDLEAERLIEVVSFLQSMRSLLRISSQNYSLDYFTKKILGNFVEEKTEMDVIDSSSTQVVCAESAVDAPETTTDMEIVKEEGEVGKEDIVRDDGMTIAVMGTSAAAATESTNPNDDQQNEKIDPREDEIEAEFEDTSTVPHKDKNEFEQDEVELDRIQLNLIRVVLGDLHSLFGLQDRDDKKPIPRFPLNQLTWPEIARMIIITAIGKDLAKTEDEVSDLFPPLLLSLSFPSLDYQLAEREQAISFQASKEYCSCHSNKNGSEISSQLLHWFQ
jgi:hypothetical protein